MTSRICKCLQLRNIKRKMCQPRFKNGKCENLKKEKSSTVLLIKYFV